MSQTFILAVLCWLSAAQPLGGLYGLDDFRSIRAPSNHVTLTCRFTEQYLVVQADIAPNWHLYSITQPEGATIRTAIKIDSPELTLQEIRPIADPHVDSDNVFGVDLEEHGDSVTWILTFAETIPTDQTIKGTLDGMVCQTGEGGTCIPLPSIMFEATFDPNLDVTPLLKQAGSVAERFVHREPATVSPCALLSGTATQSPALDAGFDVIETVNVGNFWYALLFAFLGGVILNFMPCVLPVIGLKILSFFEQAGKSRTRALMLNIWYSLGLLTVFLVLAFLSLGLSILFTFDLFAILMACIVFVMALSLMDIWTLNAPSFSSGTRSAMNQEGIFGTYFKGIITTLLAIPCGAPLLSPAVNWADMQIRSGNMPAVLLMYSMIGLGMASPYLLLGAFPEWLRFLPKPGAWMETFKKTMGFCLLLAVVWILYFVPIEKLLPTVTLLFALWFVCWLFGEQQLAGTPRAGAPLAGMIISPIVLGLVILFSYQLPGINNPYTLESAMRARLYRYQGHGHQGEHWKPYSEAALESALASGRTVIIDFTADWCLNCKVLAATVLHTEPILTLLDEKKIVSLEADCTRQGEAMNLLLQLGPNQVPALAIFDPAKPTQPTILRGYYTQKTLAELLNKY